MKIAVGCPYGAVSTAITNDDQSMKQLKYNNILIWILIIPFALFTSCADNAADTDDNKGFYNIDTVNNEVDKSIGIDILAFKKKSDEKYKVDPEYYKTELEAMTSGNDMDLYLSFGLKTTKDNGDPILESEVNKYRQLMLNALKKSLILDDCKSTKTQDSSCYWKNQIIDWVDSEKLENRYINYSSLCDEFYMMYQKGYLNEEELNYTVVYLYVMMSIDTIDNHPPKRWDATQPAV